MNVAFLPLLPAFTSSLVSGFLDLTPVLLPAPLTHQTHPCGPDEAAWEELAWLSPIRWLGPTRHTYLAAAEWVL